jgi:hypothetical protein
MSRELDNWITGHYGEDQFRDELDDDDTSDIPDADDVEFQDGEISPISEEETHWKYRHHVRD